MNIHLFLLVIISFHILCGLLSSLLTNLPSTLFYESKVETFVKFVSNIPHKSSQNHSKNNSNNNLSALGLDMSKLKGVNMDVLMKLTQQNGKTQKNQTKNDSNTNTNLKSNGNNTDANTKSDEKNDNDTNTNNSDNSNNTSNKPNNNTNDKNNNESTDDPNESKEESKHGLSSEHCDYDVASIEDKFIDELKTKLLTEMGGIKNNHYALLSIIFHLFKQVTAHEKDTSMTCDSLSSIFCQVFESRIFLAKSTLNPNDLLRMKFFIKVLIFYAYAIFPV